MTTITVREATVDDVEQLSYVAEETWVDTYVNEELGITKEDILARGFTDPERAAKRRAHIAEHQQFQHIWVAECDGKIVGFCRAIRADEKWIEALYVLPSFQRRGIGMLLFQKAMEWLNESPFDSGDVFLSVASYNQKALAFYRKLGFVETGQPVNSDIAKLPSGKVIPEIELARPAQSSP